MAGGQERELKRRIKSVQSTKKITKAMELISASRIAKAQERVAAARPYSQRITEVIRNLAAAGAGGDSPLLSPRDQVTTVAYVVVAADRGLAGSYNSGVIRAAERAMNADRDAGRDTALITVGKKATGYFRFRNYDIAASFVGFSDEPRYENARDVAEHIASRFESGEYSEVHLAFTQFLSMGTQIVQVDKYMPLDTAVIADTRADSGDSDGLKSAYEFEPGPDEILERLLPRYAEARLYAAFLDAAASEHAARQRAMKAATDNAEDMIVRLSRVMNRARQDSITTEIMEIVGGAEALRQSATDSSDLLIDQVGVSDVFGHTKQHMHPTDHFTVEDPS